MVLTKMFSDILDQIIKTEGVLKLKHIQESADLMQKQIYMRSSVRAKINSVDVKKGPIPDSLNANFKIDYSPLVLINYPIYGYLERKNRVQIGSKYDGFNNILKSVQVGRSFKYDKWST
jgi:hypothetical protein